MRGEARQRSIAEVVLGTTPPGRLRQVLIAATAAVVAHGSLWLWARRDSPARPATTADRWALTKPELAIDLIPPARAKTGERDDAPERSSPRALPRSRLRNSAPARAPASPTPPAVIATEPTPDGPLDFTGETIVGESAHGRPGGATEGGGAGGTGTAVRGSGGPAPRPIRGPDLSAAVSLANESWSCPWPHEADGQPVNERTVVIRALVGPQGRAESVEVVSDPGDGFGAAATACAMEARFAPARKPNGEPTRARSPPIRVKFTR